MSAEMWIVLIVVVALVVLVAAGLVVRARRASGSILATGASRSRSSRGGRHRV